MWPADSAISDGLLALCRVAKEAAEGCLQRLRELGYREAAVIGECLEAQNAGLGDVQHLISVSRARKLTNPQ